jgi:hypothetical protein
MIAIFYAFFRVQFSASEGRHFRKKQTQKIDLQHIKYGLHTRWSAVIIILYVVKTKANDAS